MWMEALGQRLQKQRSKCFQLPQKVSYNFTVIYVVLVMIFLYRAVMWGVVDYFGEGAKKCILFYSAIISTQQVIEVIAAAAATTALGGGGLGAGSGVPSGVPQPGACKYCSVP